MRAGPVGRVRCQQTHDLEDDMTSAIRLKQTGGPQVLGLEQVEQSVPGSGQAWIEQHAIGVEHDKLNHI